MFIIQKEESAEENLSLQKDTLEIINESEVIIGENGNLIEAEEVGLLGKKIDQKKEPKTVDLLGSGEPQKLTLGINNFMKSTFLLTQSLATQILNEWKILEPPDAGKPEIQPLQEKKAKDDAATVDAAGYKNI